jgi:hypothetical protein
MAFQTKPRVRDDETLVRRRTLAIMKGVARGVVRAPRNHRRLVLIFGCQRSGTTMMQETMLGPSWRVQIVEEHDRRLVVRSPEADETRWQCYETVVERLRRLPFEVVVAKPLVESSRAIELMDASEPVKGIWMLRRHDAVARSNVERFGPESPYRDVQAFCADDPLEWRSEGATTQTKSTVKELSRDGLSPLDAAALFWWARNQLYFDQRLWADERVRVVRYERACGQTEELVEALSAHVGITLPIGSICKKVRAPRKGGEIGDLHPDVERLCRETWESFEGMPEL